MYSRRALHSIADKISLHNHTISRLPTIQNRIAHYIERRTITSIDDISIIFGMVVMPRMYHPMLRAAADSQLMGRHVNSPIYTALTTLFLVLICVAAVAEIRLLVITQGGQL